MTAYFGRLRQSSSSPSSDPASDRSSSSDSPSPACCCTWPGASPESRTARSAKANGSPAWKANSTASTRHTTTPPPPPATDGPAATGSRYRHSGTHIPVGARGRCSLSSSTPALPRSAAFSTVSSTQGAPGSSPTACVPWGWRCDVHRPVSRPAAQSQQCESVAQNLSPVSVIPSRSGFIVSDNVSQKWR